MNPIVFRTGSAIAFSSVELDDGYVMSFEWDASDQGVYPVGYTRDGFAIQSADVPEQVRDELIAKAYRAMREGFDE